MCSVCGGYEPLVCMIIGGGDIIMCHVLYPFIGYILFVPTTVHFLVSIPHAVICSKVHNVFPA